MPGVEAATCTDDVVDAFNDDSDDVKSFGMLSKFSFLLLMRTANFLGRMKGVASYMIHDPNKSEQRIISVLQKIMIKRIFSLSVLYFKSTLSVHFDCYLLNFLSYLTAFGF